MSFYTLDADGNPAKADAFKWMPADEKRVELTDIGESSISTVFLILDHNCSNDGPPVLWETMVFGGPLDGEMERCPGNREQAEAMHEKIVQRVKDATEVNNG